MKVKCPDCGEEIIQLPSVSKMGKAIKDHADKHPVEQREQIENSLIVQVFKNYCRST